MAFPFQSEEILPQRRGHSAASDGEQRPQGPARKRASSSSPVPSTVRSQRSPLATSTGGIVQVECPPDRPSSPAAFAPQEGDCFDHDASPGGQGESEDDATSALTELLHRGSACTPQTLIAAVQLLVRRGAARVRPRHALDSVRRCSHAPQVLAYVLRSLDAPTRSLVESRAERLLFEACAPRRGGLCAAIVAETFPRALLSRERDPKGRTVLLAATEDGNTEAALALVSASAVANLALPSSAQALEAALRSPGGQDLSLALIARGAAATAPSGEGLLALSCQNSHWDAARALLRTYPSTAAAAGGTGGGQFVRWADEWGCTALHYACARGAPVDLVRALLERLDLPAAARARTAAGLEPLQLARTADVACALIDAGAEATADIVALSPAETQQLILCNSRAVPPAADLRASLARAGEARGDGVAVCARCATAEERQRVVHRVAGSPRPPWWLVSLHVAARVGDADLVCALLAREARALVCSRDPAGCVALHYSCMWSQEECSLAILSACSSDEVLKAMMLRDCRGRTALDLALDGRSARTVQEMLARGAPLRNVFGRGFASAAVCEETCRIVVAKIVAACAKGNRYTDRDFAPGPRALFREPETAASRREAAKWVRVSEQSGHRGLFRKGTASAGDVQLGSYGSAALLNCTSVLYAADGGKLLRKAVFHNPKSTDQESGVFAVRLYSPEKRHLFVIVDDYLPFSAQRRGYMDQPLPLFSYTRNSDGGQWFLPILEKCLAKLMGSYEELRERREEEIMPYLLLGSQQTMDLGSVDLLDQRLNGSLWRQLVALQADQNTKHYFVCTARGREEAMDGLVPGHTYGVLSFVELASRYHLVLLYSPFASETWKGAWSSDSAMWTAEAKESLLQEHKGKLPSPSSETSFFMARHTTPAIKAPVHFLKAVFSDKVEKGPFHFFCCRQELPCKLALRVVQQEPDSDCDEVQIVAGYLPASLYSEQRLPSALPFILVDSSPLEVIAADMDVAAKTRPEVQKQVSLEVDTAKAASPGANQRDLFVGVLWRPTALGKAGTPLDLAIMRKMQKDSPPCSFDTVPVRFSHPRAQVEAATAQSDAHAALKEYIDDLAALESTIIRGAPKGDTAQLREELAEAQRENADLQKQIFLLGSDKGKRGVSTDRMFGSTRSMQQHPARAQGQSAAHGTAQTSPLSSRRQPPGPARQMSTLSLSRKQGPLPPLSDKSP
eukprot:m51a1_g8766 putative dek1-calpain-like protein (1199) ;mRNA; r:147089-151407